MALGPIDYLGAMPQVDFGRDIMQGLQLGQQFQQRRLDIEQKERAAAAVKQYQLDIEAVRSAPTAQAYADLALKYPQQREAYKQAWEQVDESQRRAEGETALQTLFALESNKPDIAKQVIQRRIDAIDNSGGDSSQEKSYLSMIDEDPNILRGELLRWATFTQDPKNLAENLSKLGSNRRADELQPSVVREAVADAASAEAGVASAQAKAVSDTVAARYAEPEALAKLEGIRTDNEYKRNQTKIGYLNAQIARENNTLQRQKLNLELQKTITERDEKVRSKVADAESGAASIDNMLNNIERILNVGEVRDGKGQGTGKGTSLLRAAAGPFDSRIPTLQGDVADFESLVETLGSQAFLSQLPNIKGLGALSNAEGEKLQSAFQNFSLRQTPEQIIANLKDAKRLLRKGRDAVGQRYGIDLGTPDTPAAAKLPSGWSVTVEGQ